MNKTSDNLCMKTILIVEDESILRECIRDMLEGDQWIVYEARNGREGLDFLANHKVDLVLTDIDMPIKNGLEMLKEFRTTNAETPVVVMSGKVTLDQKALMSLGATSFMQKPFVDLESLSQFLVTAA